MAVGFKKIAYLLLLTALTFSCSSFNFFGEKETTSQLTPSTDPKRPHPKSPVSWKIRAHLAKNKIEDLEPIKNCRLVLSKVNLNTHNTQLLIESKEDVKDEIAEDVISYHWCFYFLLQDLDLLVDDQSMNMNQNINLFYDEIKKLWVLSRSLYDMTYDDTYYNFLKIKYIEISNISFGQNIESFWEPVDEEEE